MRKVDTLMKVIVRSFIRWSWLLVLCLVVGFVAGKVLAAALPPTYQSTAVVQLNAQSHASQTNIIQPVAAYSTHVTSDTVVEPVFQKYPHLDRQAFITKNLVVIPDTPSQSIQIQVTLPNARMAADIANSLAQSLVVQENASIKSQYDTEIRLYTGYINNEQKTIDNLNKQYAATPPANTAALTQLSNQISQERTQQSSYIATQQGLLTEQALYSRPFTIIQSAAPATKPSSVIGSIPFVPVMLLVVFLLGLMVITLLEQAAGRINEVYALQQKVSVPVLGSLRWERPMPLRELIEAKTEYAEDCRVMMADVLFHAEEAKARIIAIMGMRPAAGTSSIAAQLAAMLAQSKRRILLIDANLYTPTLHEQVGVPNEAGLALMLEEARKVKMNTPSGPGFNSSVDIIDKLPVDNFIKPTSLPGLYLLPAGKTRLNPADLLSMPEMGQFLKWASQPVDFIIIDCPPLNHGDAHVLGSLSDQTLVVVDATKDRMKQVLNIKEDLANTGIKLCGLIVNKLGRWV